MRRLILSGLLVITSAIIITAVRDQSESLALVGLASFLLGCALGGYMDNWIWTGIGPYTYVKKPNEEFDRGKTLWDILQLLVVPAALSFGVVWFNQEQAASEDARAQNQTWDSILDSYFTQVSDLMLSHHLGPHATQSVRAIARARTLTAISRLDNSRRALVVRFLSESDLVPVVSLSIAPLSGVNLAGIYLSCPAFKAVPPDRQYAYARARGSMLPICANFAYTWLNRANLSYADLMFANFDDANLSGSNLSFANLTGANLSGAILSRATLFHTRWDHTTCPDGTSSFHQGTRRQSCVGHLSHGSK